jgi:glycosyltransferase involved in cell wall biosynthesis
MSVGGAGAARSSVSKVSVIVPVLYGESQLAATLAGVAALRDRLDVEIVLVVDVPDPGREAEARARNDPLARSLDAVTVYRVGERGFGSALRRGFGAASGEAFIPMMGDASDRPEDIPRLVEGLNRGFDVVAGSRYMPGGDIVGNTPKQRLSRLYSALIRLAGGPPIHDVSNAFKGYRRAVADTVPTEADSFDVSVELTVKAALAGFRVGEVPTVWTNRTQGRSSFSLPRELPHYWRWLRLVLASRARPRRGSRRPALGPVRRP